MNEGIGFSRQKMLCKFNIGYLTTKSNPRTQQGGIKEESIGGICLGALHQKTH